MLEFSRLGGPATGVQTEPTLTSSLFTYSSPSYSTGLRPYQEPRPIAEITHDALETARAGVRNVRDWISAQRRSHTQPAQEAGILRRAISTTKGDIIAMIHHPSVKREIAHRRRMQKNAMAIDDIVTETLAIPMPQLPTPDIHVVEHRPEPKIPVDTHVTPQQIARVRAERRKDMGNRPFVALATQHTAERMRHLWNERKAKKEAWHAANRTAPPKKRRRTI